MAAEGDSLRAAQQTLRGPDTPYLDLYGGAAFLLAPLALAAAAAMTGGSVILGLLGGLGLALVMIFTMAMVHAMMENPRASVMVRENAAWLVTSMVAMVWYQWRRPDGLAGAFLAAGALLAVPLVVTTARNQVRQRHEALGLTAQTGQLLLALPAELTPEIDQTMDRAWRDYRDLMELVNSSEASDSGALMELRRAAEGTLRTLLRQAAAVDRAWRVAQRRGDEKLVAAASRSLGAWRARAGQLGDAVAAAVSYQASGQRLDGDDLRDQAATLWRLAEAQDDLADEFDTVGLDA